ncbi:hypothetical protein IMSAGC003_02608 [Lachnospiraceae bacterium]|nr:hypothetical protein IMSAGC003_02608 [Lachnospiraceae bacterium]
MKRLFCSIQKKLKKAIDKSEKLMYNNFCVTLKDANSILVVV